MKFYQKRGFALVVLVLAILGSCVYGISKKPADLPQVSYGNWLRDDADLLTDETEAALRQYDQSWDSDYRAIIAVATLDTLNGWTYEKAAAELGSQSGLGGNDMLLLLVKDSDYYVALGDNVLNAERDRLVRRQGFIRRDDAGCFYLPFWKITHGRGPLISGEKRV